MTAIISYCPNAQKNSGLFDRLLTSDVLDDICLKVTGQTEYQIHRDTTQYNKGRLLYIDYEGKKNYISLSENDIRGRNSSIQSVPTALNLFFADPLDASQKRMFYYFLPHTGNAFTTYHLFIYSLLASSGVTFLNYDRYCDQPLLLYNSIDEVIDARDKNRYQNGRNNSSYISKTSDKIQVYAKVYGASKYESTLFAIAVSHIADRPIDLFNICEQELKTLPKPSLNTIQKLGNISVHDTSLTLEKKAFAEAEDKTTLRSPRYLYNLFERLGSKHCALCNCKISEIIQGAHIWGVSDIVKSNILVSDEERFGHAISGHNGLWLCQNHHKLFDSHIISFDSDGHILVANRLNQENFEYIRGITTYTTLLSSYLSDDFRWYLSQRNTSLDLMTHLYL